MPLPRVLLDQQPPSCLETVRCSNQKPLSGGLDASRFSGLPAPETWRNNHAPFPWHVLGARRSRDETRAGPMGTGDESPSSGTVGLVRGRRDPAAAFQNVPGQRVRASFQTSIHRKRAQPLKIYLAKSGHRIQSLRSEREDFALWASLGAALMVKSFTDTSVILYE